MTFLEKKEKEIKERHFGNSKVLVEKSGATTIKWTPRNEKGKEITYQITKEHLFITGDFGDAIFSLPMGENLESVKDLSFSSFLRALSCSSKNRWNFSDKKAMKELHSWHQDVLGDEELEDAVLEEIQAVKEKIEDAISQSSSVENFQHWVWLSHQEMENDFFDAQDFDMLSEFGKEVPECFITYYVGLKLSLEMLLEKTEQEKIVKIK